MKRLLIILVPVLALGGLVGWRLQQKEKDALAQTKQREARSKAPVMVSVAPVVRRDIVETFEASGSVEAPFNVKLSAKTPGRIEFLQVREGDRVQAGQVLVRLDSSDIEAEVNRQRALLAEAQSRLAQAMLTENPTNTAVTSQIREREADLASAEADRDQVMQNSASRKAAMRAAVDDSQGRINDADAAIATAEAGIRSAQASLENGKAKLNRVSELYRQGFIAAQEVDDAKTAVSVQEQDVEVARGKLNAAKAQHASMVAQREAAQKQYDIGLVTTVANQKAAQAKVKQAEAALQTARANTAQKPAYQQNLAALRATVAAAQAAVRNAEALRADTVITAPMNGVVTARNMDPGTLATPGQPILTLQTAAEVWVTFPVPENASGGVHMGMPVGVTLDSYPGRNFAGKIVQVNPSADPASRQFQVRAGLDNRANLIKPGMFARVSLETSRVRGALVVPREAVQQGKGGSEVVVVGSDNVARRRPVTTGAADASGIAVVGGVDAGERVVNLSASPVKDGVTVRIGGAKPRAGSKPAV